MEAEAERWDEEKAVRQEALGLGGMDLQRAHLADIDPRWRKEGTPPSRESTEAPSRRPSRIRRVSIAFAPRCPTRPGRPATGRFSRRAPAGSTRRTWTGPSRRPNVSGRSADRRRHAARPRQSGAGERSGSPAWSGCSPSPRRPRCSSRSSTSGSGHGARRAPARPGSTRRSTPPREAARRQEAAALGAPDRRRGESEVPRRPERRVAGGGRSSGRGHRCRPAQPAGLADALGSRPRAGGRSRGARAAGGARAGEAALRLALGASGAAAGEASPLKRGAP